MSGSPEKKQKTEEEEAKDEEMAPEPEKKAAAEPPKELEEDAKKDTGAKIKDTVTFLTPDTTMNVLQSTVGNVLMPLCEGGLSRLSACARASVGIKSGRYMFEAKMVEQFQHCHVRVGFSAEGSLYLGEADNSIYFDHEGFLGFNRRKTKCSAPFGRDVIVGVLLNLDDKSPNFNTISLFRDGRRVAQPQKLPEELQGKVLFPAVSFRNASMHCNFHAPSVALPFVCRGVQEATQKDAVVTKYDAPADGKHTVLFPVSLPDEGTFDWLDSFLEKNPGYTELSDRAFADWGSKSGLKTQGPKESNDKPGTVRIDDLASIKKTLMDIAALQPRNFVIMEVKGNLVKEEREKVLAKFKNSAYKTVAEVVINEPTASFKKIVHAKALKAKQDKADQEHRSKFIAEKREWLNRKKAKDAEKAKKKAEKEKAKKAKEVEKAKEKAKKEAEKKKAKAEAAAKAKAEGKEAPEEEEEAPEEPEPEEPEEEEPEEAEEPEPTDTEPPKVSLTAEEKAVRFFKHPVKDLTDKELALSFTKFTLPEKDEFDEVKYSWSKEKDAATYVKSWILERKLTTRVEDISPSTWFRQKASAWESESKKWKNKQNDFKNMVAKKLQEKKEKAAKKAKAKAEAEKKAKAKAEAEKKAKEEAEKKAAEGKEEEKKEEAKEEKEEKEEEAAPMEESEEEPEEAPLDLETVDAFSCEDITDVGNKVPLFRDFHFEDFAMMTLRFEIHLLVHAFSQDSKDEDRKNIHVDHLAFYYQKYYGKQLNFNSYGVNTVAELLALINDCIVVTTKSCLESLVPAELESNAVFAKITEAARRHRLLQVDMGEESARLKVKSDKKDGWKDGGDWSGRKRSWGEANGGGGDKKSGTWGQKQTFWGQKKVAPSWSGGKDAGKDGGKDSGKGWNQKEGGKEGGKGWSQKDAGGWRKAGGKDGGKNWGGKDAGKDGGKSWGGKDGGKDAGKGWGKQKGKW